MSHLIHEKEKVNNDLLIIKNAISKENKNNNDIKIIKRIENRNTIIKSNSNTLNHFFQEPKQEKELKAINSDRSIFENHLYKTSPKFHNIQTQTTKIMLTNVKKAKFPNIGFSYKIINLGSDIKFRESELEKINELKENAKLNIDLSSPLTNTYKLYQKKKNEKKK
jgi:formylmethanofuran dehydrogenase subunit B